MFDTLTRMGSSAAGAYEIERSLRFNSADSTKLERTPSSTGNQKVWTWSGWVKRTKLGHTDHIFGCDNDADGNNNGIAGLYFENNSDKLHTYFDTSGTAPYGAINDKVYRDTAAWYHIVWQVDAVNSDMKIWVNGVEETVASGNMPPNYSYHMNQASFRMNMGVDGWDNSTYSNLYFAEVHYCDGQEYQASDFGETDSNTGQWIPKEVSGLTYGTNGFYLNFSDNSNTTAATLGKDYSGNGNNWTPNNFSVAAGAGNDSVTDTPTNNYATLNPLFPNGTEAPGTISDGSLKFVGSGYEYAMCPSTITIQNGKYYWEVTHGGGSYVTAGIIRGTGCGSDCYISYDPNGNVFGIGYNQAGQISGAGPGGSTNGAASSTAPNSYTTNDVIGIATDIPNGTIKWYKNNTLEHTITGLNDELWFPAVSAYSNGGTALVNFGQQGFTHTPPTGHVALCTANLPTPTIKKGDAHFNTVLYTGDGQSSKALTVGFQPDLSWFKCRDSDRNHDIYDSIRGGNKRLIPNDTTEEGSFSNLVQSFDANGVTVGSASEMNHSGEDFVAWNWKAGASASNSDGSVTSTVRANASAGFSIVQYDVPSGAGNFTVGHGLGVAPELILAKNRDTDSNWDVYSKSIANTHRLKLNSNATPEDQPAWGDTSATSSVFTSLGNGAWHGIGNTMINYCFTSVNGYSKIGTYEGNNDNDGTFVFTGFKPAFLIIKDIDSAGEWSMYDSARTPVNPMTKNIRADEDSQENDHTVNSLDFLANGFKLRDDDAGKNAARTYLYIAIAERPFKYANAR